MKFTKMHGTGNDFVVINALEEQLPDDLVSFSKKIGDRHFGVGCDQILIVDTSDIADFKMLIFNRDGSQVEMCGNGIRCLARYVYEKGLTDKKKLEIETLAGIIKPEIVGDQVRVDMGTPRFKTDDWDIDKEKVVDHPLEVNGKEYRINLISMGNPHCIIFVDDVERLDLHTIGPLFENHDLFPNRINTEFIQVLSKDEVKMRVWERGSGETLACGTGASASAVACVLNNKTNKEVLIHLEGGDLKLHWDDHVFMMGPAEFVFEGEYLGN